MLHVLNSDKLQIQELWLAREHHPALCIMVVFTDRCSVLISFQSCQGYDESFRRSRLKLRLIRWNVRMRHVRRPSSCDLRTWSLHPSQHCACTCQVSRVVKRAKTAKCVCFRCVGPCVRSQVVVKPLNPLSDTEGSLGPFSSAAEEAVFCRRGRTGWSPSSSGCAVHEGRHRDNPEPLEPWGPHYPSTKVDAKLCKKKTQLREFLAPKLLETYSHCSRSPICTS